MSSQPRKRVAIIGAGVCGITTAKAVLEENSNIEVICYERSRHTGGLWRFVDEETENSSLKNSREDTATVMHSTVINSGKEVSAFSDFPPPKSAPNFMHNSQWMTYIDAYANFFGFNRLVRLEHEVVSVQPSPTNEIDGSWTVLVKNYQHSGDPETVEEHFDAVYICTGHHGRKRVPPPLPGQVEHFAGEVVHAHDVKSGARFRGKRVVVVGLGNSGADLAAELGPIARQVYVSLKRGTWVSYRVGPFGRPMDHYFLRRAVQLLINWTPLAVFSGLLHCLLNFRFDHRLYCLQPETPVLGQHITINDALPNLLISGRVEIRAKMVGFEEGNTVLLEDGSKLKDIDAIIFATGYQMFSFPFLSKSLATSLRLQTKPVNRVPLYQYVFSPHLPAAARHTLAFIGLVQPIGPIMNMAELQARWAVKLLNQPEKYQLPLKEEMLADIEQKRVKQSARFYESDRHTISFDWLPYMDELAGLVGCRAPLFKLFFTDIRLWWALVFGCAGAYQYRLVGPNAWPEARATILSLEERVEAPFATRRNDADMKKDPRSKTGTSGTKFIFLGLLFFLALYYLSLVISTFF